MPCPGARSAPSSAFTLLSRRRLCQVGRRWPSLLLNATPGYFDFLDREPEFTRLLQWENLEKGRHLAKENHLLSKNPFLARFRAIIEDGVAAGEFRRDLDVTHLVIHFIGLCFIYHSNRFSLSQSLELDLGSATVKRRGLNQVLRLVFEGIAAKPR